jgi:hypothetical protein
VGFNNRGFGAFLPCEVKDGKIVVYRNSGEIREYKTTLKVNIPKQCYIYSAIEVLFYLEHEGICYIGRENGSISGYRMSDNLLVKISSWESPKSPLVRDCGVYYLYKELRAVLDLSDMRTVYFSDIADEYIFNEPFHMIVDTTASLARAFTLKSDYHIITREGVVDTSASGRWFVQDIYGIRDKKQLI